MPVIETDKIPLSEGFKYELCPRYNRDTVTIASGQSEVTEVLTVLGKITATSEFTLLNPAAADGSQIAAGINCSQVDATLASALSVVVTRGPAIVNPNKLIWPDGITENQKTTALANFLVLGIKSGIGV